MEKRIDSIIINLFKIIGGFSLIFFSIFFFDPIVAFIFSNKYPEGLIMSYPAANFYFTKIFEIITYFGNPIYLMPFILLLLFYLKITKKKLKKLVWNSLLAIFLGSIYSTIFKIIFLRSRPFVNWNNLDFYFITDLITKKIPFNGSFMSFPSGHAAITFSLYLFLYYKSKNRCFKIIWIFLAVIISFSRIYLSQHWFSDIIVSLFLGIAIAKRLQRNL